MKSKTIKLIDGYLKALNEQGENGMPTDDQQAPSPDVTENPEPAPQETIPLTSESENNYISMMIDAALYSPESPERIKELNDLKSVMQMKKFSNSREEILPQLLGIISPQTDKSEVSNSLDGIEN